MKTYYAKSIIVLDSSTSRAWIIPVPDTFMDADETEEYIGEQTGVKSRDSQWQLVDEVIDAVGILPSGEIIDPWDINPADNSPHAV